MAVSPIVRFYELVNLVYESDNVTPTTLRAEQCIDNKGGFIEIAHTGVNIEIPSGSLKDKRLIQIGIMPHDMNGECTGSFTSNASVVVELLPSIITLQLPVKVSLPHCLVFEKGYKPTATIYTSHHEEGQTPQWEEAPEIRYEVGEHNCVIWLDHFSRFTACFGNVGVTDRNIVLFAATRSLTGTNIILDIGYYWKLPGGDEIIHENKFTVLKKNYSLFRKKKRTPLTIRFAKTEPSSYCDDENPKVIPFKTVAKLNGNFKSFVLKRKENETKETLVCYFKAGQKPKLEDLTFEYMVPILCISEQPSTSSRAENTNTRPSLPPEITLASVVPNDTCKYLSDRIGRTWKNVARSLRISETQQDQLIHELRDLEEIVYHMLLKWKQNNGDNATFKVLTDALEEAGRVDLRDEVLKDISINT